MVLALCLGPSLAALQATLALVAPRLVHDQRRCCVSAKAPVAEPVAGGVTRGPVSVFDGVLGPKTLQLICEAGRERGHSYTSVFDRGTELHAGRTIVEATLCALLDEIGDRCRYVEYWWRGDWIAMNAHRDIDEAHARTYTRAGAGVQRCPTNGHVLYLDVDPRVEGPTCVWEEAPAADDGRRAGPPRELRALHVVPARAGRLLRFQGELIHAVPRPATQWLAETPSGHTSGDEAHAAAGGAQTEPPARLRREVLLFNTWEEPPTLPSPDDPVSPAAAASYAALERPIACVPREAWAAPATGRPDVTTDEALVTVEVPLLGDARRRACDAAVLGARAPAAALATALTSKDTVYAVALTGGVGGGGGAAAALPDGEIEGEIEVHAEEELAMAIGYAEHLEADFFGTGDDGDDWDDDDDDDW